MVICLERGADLHVAQLMPLPLTVFCFSKMQTGFTFLVPAYLGSPGQRAAKRVCVCVCVPVVDRRHTAGRTVHRRVQCMDGRSGAGGYTVDCTTASYTARDTPVRSADARTTSRTVDSRLRTDCCSAARTACVRSVADSGHCTAGNTRRTWPDTTHSVT